MVILIVIGALLLIICWLGLLWPVYAAWKNKRYKTVAVSLCSIFTGILSFSGMVWYGDWITALLQGVHNTPNGTQDTIMCILGFVCVVSHSFSWWYVYGRKTWDYMYIEGHTADEISKIISPECKELLGLN